MIEINLLPGAGKSKKKASRGGSSVSLAAAFGGFTDKVKDKFLAAAVIAVALSLGVVGTLYSTQSKQESRIQSALDKAVQDSAHYAAVSADAIKAEAKRDTVLRQLNIIRTIDEDRFIWPHILDEISKALPQYTWLTVVNFTGTPQGTNNVAAAPAKPADAGAPADTSKKGPVRRKRLDTNVPRDEVKIRIMGRTVDIQALTRFMRQLEASPFLGNVTIQKTETALDAGQQVTQFTIDVMYTRPDTSMIRRVPLSVSVK
jgi:Tfp pilus assembly protein PilN